MKEFQTHLHRELEPQKADNSDLIPPKPVINSYVGINYIKRRPYPRHPEAAYYFIEEEIPYPVWERNGKLYSAESWNKLFPNISRKSKQTVQTNRKTFLLTKLRQRLYSHFRNYQEFKRARVAIRKQGLKVPEPPAIKIENEHDRALINFFIDEIYKNGMAGFPPRMDINEPLVTDDAYVQKVMEAYSKKPAGYEDNYKALVPSLPQSNTYKEYIQAAGAKMPSELNKQAKEKAKSDKKKKEKKSRNGKGVKSSKNIKKKSTIQSKASSKKDPIALAENLLQSQSEISQVPKKRLFTEISQDDRQQYSQPEQPNPANQTERFSPIVQSSPVLFSEVEDSPIKVFTGLRTIPETQLHRISQEQYPKASTSRYDTSNPPSGDSKEQDTENTSDTNLHLHLSSGNEFDESKCPLETSGWPSDYEATPKKKEQLIITEPSSSEESETDEITSSSAADPELTEQSRSDEAEAANSMEKHVSFTQLEKEHSIREEKEKFLNYTLPKFPSFSDDDSQW